MPHLARKKDGRVENLAKMCSVKECIRKADGVGAKAVPAGVFKGAWGDRLGVGREESLNQGTSGWVGWFSGHLHPGHPHHPHPHPSILPLTSSRRCGPRSPVQAR